MRQLIADLTTHLGFKQAIVVVEILMRRVAVCAADMFEYRDTFNRFKLFASFREVFLKQKFVIFGYDFFLNLAGRSFNGGVESTKNFL